MQVQGVNHITFSVEDIERSVSFYQRVLKAKLLFREGATAYLELGGAWLALNEQQGAFSAELRASCSHIAFTISLEDWEDWKAHLANQNALMSPGRKRSPEEGLSLYFYDPDGRLLELHTGSLSQRLSAYSKEHL